MKFDNKVLHQWSIRSAILAAAVYFSISGLSSFYYKTPVLDPVIAWHGANLSVRSLLSEGISTRDVRSQVTLGKFKQENGLVAEMMRPRNAASPRADMNHHNMKNLIASRGTQSDLLERDKDRLKSINEQLLNSKSTLDSLDQNFSDIVAHQQKEVTDRQSIEKAIALAKDVPTKAEVNSLIAESGRTITRPVQKIPQKVLINVQQTTGISPEEINALMNQ